MINVSFRSSALVLKGYGDFLRNRLEGDRKK